MPPWPTMACTPRLPDDDRAGGPVAAAFWIRNTFAPPKTMKTSIAMVRLKRKLDRNSDVGAKGSPAL